MRIRLSQLSVVIAALVLAFSAYAQDDVIRAAAGDKYVISAKAGGVNFVEGTVTVEKRNGRAGRLLKGDTLAVGDRVFTSADGKAEILLNPGSYVRLGGNSAFEFKTTSLDDLNLVLHSGSAIFEVFAADDFRVQVKTLHTQFDLIETGIYRVDASSGSTAVLSVWKGKAEVGGANGSIVKGGREATVGTEGVAIAKFDRDDKDSLDSWSKARAKELSKISANLQRKTLRTTLMQSFLGRGWNVYDSFGLWVYDPFGRSYCFLPFGWGWRSPYGYGFGSHLGSYRLPSVVYYPPANPGPSGGTPGRGEPGRGISQRGTVPPFVRMEGTTGVSAARSRLSDAASAPFGTEPRTSPSVFPSPPASSSPVSGRGENPSKGRP